MDAFTESWSNMKVRSVIRFLCMKGNLPVEIHRQLVEVYNGNVMLRKHVWVYCTEFDKSRTDVQTEQRSGRPNTSFTDDNLFRIGGLIQDDRRIRIRDTAEELNISVGSVHKIVHERLNYERRAHAGATATDRNSQDFQDGIVSHALATVS
ncbi:putative uncharacterized protein FLJ37770 [Centruroides sculpturatus]|uniref:putative uncharacterized protein FLJ37770 n=1 Tax=Centruroides sculpturatus TaxID=218467 RepID=UPI000C6DC8FC|nr:putative uncharacterized protein FLJ37770 [Centruroides sculpturatus]